ncbi:HlyD family efflux transporter periplasmic adaptor subunit [Allorhodopirellula heiligendammensis]|uniref:HlyD family secretion protein n=1 Tax=Allorhodopirellula heiligendammensis TaxID=2714739 RepID=A0A5C6BXB9_9BACT|nr:HlyD family efflux transporter periplasmic adaptor subunit [Allorhodopirellula heiligendammensis]TWU16605.1 HlyD family secretion protein [Allorhodopirellula heiligendammensis]
MKRFVYLTLIMVALTTNGFPPHALAGSAVQDTAHSPDREEKSAEKGASTEEQPAEEGAAKPKTSKENSSAATGADSAAERKDEPKEPEVLKVEGVFEAVQAWELIHDLDQIQTLEIEKILPHGTVVTKGQTVVWFDAESIDKKIATAEIELKLAELAAADDQFSYDQFLETQKLDRDAAERARHQARQNYDNYVKVDREQTIANAKFSLKNSQYYLENAQEELTQLTQMYEEDDLTEESEEIVMKRAKQAVESAEFNLENAKVRTSRIMDQTVPQRDKTEEADLAKAEMAYQKAIHELTSSKQQRDLKRKQAATELAEKSENFETLLQQRKEIVMKSPGDGIVMHGELTRGALGAKPSSIEAGSKISQDQVIATIVNPDRLRVRLELSETQLAQVVPDAKCVVKPNSLPDTAFNGIVARTDKVPFAAKKFDAEVKLKGKIDDSIVPTMTCSVEFTK